VRTVIAGFDLRKFNAITGLLGSGFWGARRWLAFPFRGFRWEGDWLL
jgi:hypothetical protein